MSDVGHRQLQKAHRWNKHTAKFGIGRPNELVLELSTTGRLYQGVQPAGGVDLAHGLVVNGLREWARECLEETL
jgi:hypothetical protein